MTKAVLIMDMPESCFDCNFMYCDEESDTETCQAMETVRDIDLIEDRPDWCPLRELPGKIGYTSEGFGANMFKAGFNACLAEILAERKE
jgi:hypothetical protein